MTAPRRFDYEALETDGSRRRGALEAVDLNAARDRLLADGVTPLKLSERRNIGARPPARRNLREQEAGDLAADLSRLLGAGIPLVEALRTVATISRTAQVRTLADFLARRIEAGGALSASLREVGEGGAGMLAALAAVGEQSGALGETLRDAAETLRDQAQLRARILSLLLYPAVVATLTLVVLLIFLLVVAPALQPAFAGFEERLPVAARVLFAVSDGARIGGPWVFAGLCILAGILSFTGLGRALLRSAGETIALSPISLGAPATAAYSAYARALALALRRGVRLPEAHKAAAQTLWAPTLRRALIGEARHLESGSLLSTILKRAPLAPPALVQLAAAGESAGRLAPALGEAAALLADDARLKAERLVALAGPAITIILGGLVGLVVMTLFRALASIAEMAA